MDFYQEVLFLFTYISIVLCALLNDELKLNQPQTDSTKKQDRMLQAVLCAHCHKIYMAVDEKVGLV